MNMLKRVYRLVAETKRGTRCRKPGAVAFERISGAIKGLKSPRFHWS